MVWFLSCYLFPIHSAPTTWHSYWAWKGQVFHHIGFAMFSSLFPYMSRLLSFFLMVFAKIFLNQNGLLWPSILKQYYILESLSIPQTLLYSSSEYLPSPSDTTYIYVFIVYPSSLRTQIPWKQEFSLCYLHWNTSAYNIIKHNSINGFANQWTNEWMSEWIDDIIKKLPEMQNIPFGAISGTWKK